MEYFSLYGGTLTVVQNQQNGQYQKQGRDAAHYRLPSFISHSCWKTQQKWQAMGYSLGYNFTLKLIQCSCKPLQQTCSALSLHLPQLQALPFLLQQTKLQFSDCTADQSKSAIWLKLLGDRQRQMGEDRQRQIKEDRQMQMREKKTKIKKSPECHLHNWNCSHTVIWLHARDSGSLLAGGNRESRMVETIPFRSHLQLHQVRKTAKEQPFIYVPGHSPWSPENSLHNQVI